MSGLSTEYFCHVGCASRVSFRWLIRHDIDEVTQNYRYKPFIGLDLHDEDELTGYLRQRNVIGSVLESSRGEILGSVIYALDKQHIEIISMCGEGFDVMINQLIAKLSQHRRNHLVISVCEYSVWMQKELSRLGFTAVPADTEIVFYNYL